MEYPSWKINCNSYSSTPGAIFYKKTKNITCVIFNEFVLNVNESELLKQKYDNYIDKSGPANVAIQMHENCAKLERTSHYFSGPYLA